MHIYTLQVTTLCRLWALSLSEILTSLILSLFLSVSIRGHPIFSEQPKVLASWPNSWTKSRQKSYEFSSVLFTVTSTLYSFALRLIFLQTHATSFTFWSSITALYNIKEKGGQPDRKPYPLPYGLRNPYRNLKSEKPQDYGQKPQQNCMFMNSASAKWDTNFV